MIGRYHFVLHAGIALRWSLGWQPKYFVWRVKRWQGQDLLLRPFICRSGLEFSAVWKLGRRFGREAFSVTKYGMARKRRLGSGGLLCNDHRNG